MTLELCWHLVSNIYITCNCLRYLCFPSIHDPPEPLNLKRVARVPEPIRADFLDSEIAPYANVERIYLRFGEHRNAVAWMLYCACAKCRRHRSNVYVYAGWMKWDWGANIRTIKVTDHCCNSAGKWPYAQARPCIIRWIQTLLSFGYITELQWHRIRLR